MPTNKKSDVEGRTRIRACMLADFLRHCWPLAVAFAISSAAYPATTQPQTKNVLVLSGGQGRVSINLMELSLRAHYREPVNFSIVDLDNPHLEQQSYQDNLAEAIRAGYSAEKLDLVVAVMTDSVRFAVQYRDKVFPGVPIVFMSDISSEKTWPGVTGVASASGIPETINLALRLHPDTEAIAVVTDVSGYDKEWLSAEQSELLRYRDKVREIDIIGPASPEVLVRVAALPPHTVALFQLFPRDANQPAFGAFDVLAAVAQRVPTYSMLPFLTVGRGGVGGATYDSTKDAVLAGELAARVLSGERPDNIPVVKNSTVNVSVDWRELQRWNIPESALPPRTQILYREPTLWVRYRDYVVAALGIIVAQTILILALFWQRSRRRKTELALRQSEEKFSKSFLHSPLAVTITRMIDSRYVEVNDTFEEQTGWKRQEVIGRTPLDIRLWENPDERVSMEEQLRATGRVRDLEFRVRRKDGQIITALGSAELIEVDGDPCALNVAADITARKLAEEALAGVGRKLIEAQEAERARLARELHDDINQRIALLAVTLHMLRQKIPISDIKTGQGIEEAYEQVANLGSDIQALSHGLHSSGLEYIGLEGAVTGFCQELAGQQNLDIQLHIENVPETLSYEISLCLFRVLQEAIQNALKYSGVREFEVSLTGTSNEIQLSVHDSGAGFDPDNTSQGHGLGLTSMRERLRLVKGHLSIESQPQQGTTIRASVPVVTEVTLDPTAASANSAA